MHDRLASRFIASPASPMVSPTASPLALLTLVGATAEWRAGMAPSCMTSVRLLDAVDFTVRGGECVVVHHDDPAAVRVLLAALSGHPRLIAGGVWRGARVASPGVRVRRASVRADLVAPLVAGWESADPRTASLGPSSTTHTSSAHTSTARRSAGYAVHLLRASRSATPAAIAEAGSGHARVAANDHEAWRAWAREQRQQGGAIVIVADARGGAGAGSGVARPRGPGPFASHASVHETASAYATSVSFVRECVLRNGRLLTPGSQDARATDQGCWPSEAPLVVDG